MTITHPEFDKHDTSQTVQAARDTLLAKIENDKKGTCCPCCGQRCVYYRRPLNSGMAATLVWLVKTFRNFPDWIHVQAIAPRHVIRSNEIGKLVHWGLVLLKPNDDDDSKRTSGHWKPTEKGIDFVDRRIRVPKYVFLYDNIVQGFSDKLITIDDALGDKFNYAALMAS